MSIVDSLVSVIKKITYNQEVKSEIFNKNISATNIIGFTGAGGGVGTSTIASYVALQLAQDKAFNVCIIDLNYQLPKQYSLLNVSTKESGEGLLKKLTNPSTDYRDTWIDTSVSNLKLISPSVYDSPLDYSVILVDNVVNMFNTATKTFDIVILDIPSTLDTELCILGVYYSKLLFNVIDGQASQIVSIEKQCDIMDEYGIGNKMRNLIMNKHVPGHDVFDFEASGNNVMYTLPMSKQMRLNSIKGFGITEQRYAVDKKAIKFQKILTGIVEKIRRGDSL